MTTVNISLEDLLDTRKTLVSSIKESLTNEERKFLISVKTGKPEWDLLGLTGVEDLPAVKWKLMNIDGVVESPIYCVAAVFQTLGILHVLPRP